MKFFRCFCVFLVLLVSGCVTVEFYNGTPSKYVKEAIIRGEVVEYPELDIPPEPIEQRSPEYPNVWKKSPIDGYANLVFVVDETGIPTQIQAEEATDRSFALSAIHALKFWRFKPGILDGKPVKVLVRVPLIFSIKQVENASVDETPK